MRSPEQLLNQKKLFDQYLGLRSHDLSTFHFSSIFLWQDFFDFEFEILDESLCVFAHQKGACFLYLPPLAKTHKPAVVEECFLKMNKINPRTARVENIEQEDLKFYTGNFKSYVKSAEYVYQKDALVDLKGHAYKSQRHDIHHFQAHHQAIFRPFLDEDKKACLELYERWARNRYEKHEDPIYRSMLEENRVVHELALNWWQALGLVGGVVEIDKKIAAYSFGYVLNFKTFGVLLEISDVSIAGLGAFIFNRFCAQDVLRQCSFINTMDDFGLPYVAASKQAYHPIHKPVSYTITLDP